MENSDMYLEHYLAKNKQEADRLGLNDEAKVILRFDILWSGWECDYYGWIVETKDGKRIAISTDHGFLVEIDSKFLCEKITMYKAVAKETEKAVLMLV